MTIQSVHILGAGQMGRDLASWCISRGLETTLVKMTDVTEGLIDKKTEQSIQADIQQKLQETDRIHHLRFISYPQFLEEAATCEWVIESVIEDLTIKQDVWSEVVDYVAAEAILSTNTSSLQVKDIATNLPEQVQERFSGVHFFTPLSRSKLVELIPLDQTTPQYINQLKQLVDKVLAKRFIVSRDVTGFVANRMGFYANYEAMYRGEARHWPIPKVDALTGAKLARVKMGPYRLTDLTGIDLSESALKAYRQNTFLAEFFPPRTQHHALLKADYVGDKAGQGYYKKEQGKRLAFDFETREYRQASFPTFPFFEKFETGDWEHNLDIIFTEDSPEAHFMWESLRNVMYFAALNVGRAADDYRTIDQALIWGYNWTLGPFQIWDKLGFYLVKERIEVECGPLPDWIQDIQGGFYSEDRPLDSDNSPQAIAEKILWHHDHQTRLSQTKQNSLVLELRTANHALNPAVLEDILAAVDELEQGHYEGLVIIGEGEHFSVGFDFSGFEMIKQAPHPSQKAKEISNLGYEVVKRLKFVRKPIVAAVRGHVLGGGAEIALQSTRIVAAAQTYMGLPEVGVGLLPAGGGLAELADRIYRQDDSRFEKKQKLLDMFNTVAYGQVSKHAQHARELGFLRTEDIIVANERYLLQTALSMVQMLSQAGHISATNIRYQALGQDFKAVVSGLVKNWRIGGYVTDFEQELANRIADVLAGGELPLGVEIDYEYLLELEQSHYLELIEHDLTWERLHHMQVYKRPLRN